VNYSWEFRQEGKKGHLYANGMLVVVLDMYDWQYMAALDGEDLWMYLMIVEDFLNRRANT